MSYTGESVYIDCDGDVISKAPFYGVSIEQCECENPLVSFGDYGFYDEWQDL